MSPGDDVNSCKTQGWWGVNPGVSNIPANSYGTLYFVRGANNSGYQLFTNLSSSQSDSFKYIRSMDENNGSWGPWSRCDSFGCSTPSALASLLGARSIEVSNLSENQSIDITASYCLVKIRNSASGNGAFFRFDNSVVNISSDNQYSVGQEESGKISIMMKSENSFTIKNGTNTSKTLKLAIYSNLS